MKPRHKRIALIAAGLAALGVALALILQAFQSNLVFFFTPTQVAAHDAPQGRSFRIGGLVETGSVQKSGESVAFSVTDLNSAVKVSYRGLLPDLFREGQGVVAEGVLGADGTFRADNVLAKHDEKYMPPEVAKKLKENGVWRGDAQAAGTPDAQGKVN